MEVSGGVKRFSAPWIPVHRIVGMLPKVGARLKVEAVGVLGGAVGIQVTGAGILPCGPTRPGGFELVNKLLVE
jgi:hypothetical protein